uniref:Protein Hikeshi n=1 Tax=Phallusia mammillata TaxID=59560 RepID=A0A6F9DDU8_9ASCI|nr:protein Hikeshi [Phallusia mammillata]
MFAVIVAGRLVQTDVTQVDDAKFMFTLADLDNVNHIVVFMTGQQPFADGIGAAVYINLAPSSAEGGWQLVGHLTNQKPSAIFKISGLQGVKSNDQKMFSHMFPNTDHPHAQLGISLEPLDQLSQQVPATSGSSIEQGSTFADFASKMLSSFYNYASSFTVSKEEIAGAAMGTGNQFSQSATQTYFLPASVLESWHKQFQHKLSRDINFWKK